MKKIYLCKYAIVLIIPIFFASCSSVFKYTPKKVAVKSPYKKATVINELNTRNKTTEGVSSKLNSNRLANKNTFGAKNITGIVRAALISRAQPKLAQATGSTNMHPEVVRAMLISEKDVKKQKFFTQLSKNTASLFAKGSKQARIVWNNMKFEPDIKIVKVDESSLKELQLGSEKALEYKNQKKYLAMDVGDLSLIIDQRDFNDGAVLPPL